VERLVQIAYSQPDLEDCQTFEFEVFFRTMNNLGFRRYLLASGVDTIEAALNKGRAFYRVDGPQRPDFTAQQLEADKRERSHMPSPVPQVVAATTASSTSTEFSMSLYMVKGIQADLKKMQQTQAGRRAPNREMTLPGLYPLLVGGAGLKDT